MLNIEHSLYDLSARLQRSEEAAHYMHIKNQAAMETVNRLLHFNQELSRAMLSIVPADSPVSRDGLYPAHIRGFNLANLDSDRIAGRNPKTG